MPEDPVIAHVTHALEPIEVVIDAIAFGSRVRGSARPDSDLDLALLYDGMNGAPRSQDMMGTLSLAIGTDVHVVDLARATLDLRRNVFRTGKRLLDRSGGRLHDLELRSLIEYADMDYLRCMMRERQRELLEPIASTPHSPRSCRLPPACAT